jgi:hypothetical protein
MAKEMLQRTLPYTLLDRAKEHMFHVISSSLNVFALLSMVNNIKGRCGHFASENVEVKKKRRNLKGE